VFDDIERGRILEQPAGKHRTPGQRRLGIGMFFDINLHECTDLGGYFPGKGPLAGGNANYNITDPSRLAGLHHQILGQIVALVEQADRRHPVLDRRAEFRLNGRTCSDGRLRHRLGDVGRLGVGVRIALARAGAQRQQGRSSKAKRALQLLGFRSPGFVIASRPGPLAAALQCT